MRKLAFILVPLLFLACGREPAAPDAVVAPNFDANASTEVVYLHPLRITWMDNDQYAGEDWDVFLIGFEPSEHWRCHGGVPGEWGGPGIPARDHLVVSMQGIPDEISQRDVEVLTTIGRPPLYLYRRSDLPLGGTLEEFCAFYKEGWIASGAWSATIYRDNEVSWFDNTPGMNVYGGIEAGVLRGPGGELYKYEWKWLRHWDRTNGTDEVIHEVDHVVRIR